MLERKKLAVSCLIFGMLIGFILGGSRSAWGHAFDNYGFGSRAIAMGGAMVGFDDQYTAVYYNPAGMAFHEGKDLSVGASYLFTTPSLHIKGTGTTNPAADRSDIASDQGVSLGMTTPLRSGKIARVITTGLGLYIPYPFVSSVIELKSYDPATPYFLQYENRNRFLQATWALSYKAWEKLSFAVGADILIHLNPLVLNVALVNNTAQFNLDTKFPLDFAPTAGLQYRPADWLSLGAAYHGKTQIKVSVQANIYLVPGQDPISIPISYRDAYKPQQVEMGFGLKPLKDLLVSGALTWVDFSDYVPPIGIVDLSEAQNSQLGSIINAFVGYIPVYNTLKFKDYWIPRLGIEYKVTPHLDARAGYFYRNSSVPPQKWNTSFIDPATNGISAGIGITFSDPLDIVDNPIHVDFSSQGQFLQKVTVNKTDSAYQSYTAEGSCHLITGTLGYYF